MRRAGAYLLAALRRPSAGLELTHPPAAAVQSYVAAAASPRFRPLDTVAAGALRRQLCGIVSSLAPLGGGSSAPASAPQQQQQLRGFAAPAGRQRQQRQQRPPDRNLPARNEEIQAESVRVAFPEEERRPTEVLPLEQAIR